MARLPVEDPAHRILSLLSRSEGLDYAEGAPTGFIVASGGVLSEGYGHDGPGVCPGNGQTETEGVPPQGGRGDALLRRMPLYLTCPTTESCREVLTSSGKVFETCGTHQAYRRFHLKKKASVS